ncbi:MAG: sugar phosphate isomerase/epimerase [Bryobacteraceae bacterium]
MPMIDRRSFLAFAASALPAMARTLKIVGVQLYTVRSVLPKKPLETLQAIEKIGYREVECTAADLSGPVWTALKQTSMKPVSVHLGTDLFIRQQDKLPAAIDDAKQRGFQYVVCPYVAPRDRGGADVARKLGETLNKAGEMAHKAGMHLCYHNHAFDFQPTPDGTLLDILLRTADPKYVGLELDIMWAQVAGVDPVSVLKKYGRRVELVHLKNVAPGVAQRYDEGIPRNAFREVGNGVIKIAPVLKAAAQAGVKHYFVEQDQTPGDPVDSLRQSYEYLEKLNY